MLLILVGEVGAVGFIHQSAVTNSMHLQSTYSPHLQYLQLEVHVESSRTSAMELYSEELHCASLTGCLTGF